MTSKIILASRKNMFANSEIYHICNKSIANYGIFKDASNSKRFIQTLSYYNITIRPQRFSYAARNGKLELNELIIPQENSLIKFISYCIMPDHYHILVKILEDNTLSKYINDVENSFTRYFNTKFKRKGPLWQTRFRSVRIVSDEQLRHVSRYIHLNPTSSGLVENPEDWPSSSYRKFIYDRKVLKNYMKEISTPTPLLYKRFVDNNKNYQRTLRKIKHLILE